MAIAGGHSPLAGPGVPRRSPAAAGPGFDTTSGGGDCAGSAPGRAEGGRAGGRRADALVGGPAASLRRSAVGGFDACFVTYIGRAGKSISMPTPIGGGTVVTAEENYHPDVQEHFDRRAAPQAHRSARVHMRRHRRTPVAERLPSRPALDRTEGTAALIAGTVRCLVEQGRLEILRGACLPERGRGRVIIALAQP